MRWIRWRGATVAAVLFAALPAATLAHAEVVRSEPAADSVLDMAPNEVVVAFDSELDPDTSSLEIITADGTVIAEGGVDLDVADRNVLRAPVSFRSDGAYLVAWTAGSIDGHVESGEFAFRVGTAPTTDLVDTALPQTSAEPAVIGALLLVLSGALGIRIGQQRPRTR